MTVTVKKLGGSVAVVIPSAVAREIDLAPGTALDITVTSAGIVLQKRFRRPRRAIGEIAAAIDPRSYRRRNQEMLEDRSIGKEKW